MSNMALQTVFIDEQQTVAAFRGQIAPFCKASWQNGIARLRVTIEPEEDAKSVQQGKFLWGVVYAEISEQARIGGIQYVDVAWHELFKRKYLPRKTKKTKVAGRSRMVVSTTIGSTKGLGIKKMSAFIEKVIAFGVTDLGVRFSETRWENYR